MRWPHTSLLGPSFLTLVWSSGEWSKARGRATIRLDQSRTRFLCRSPQLESPPFCPQAQCDDLCFVNFMFSREHLNRRRHSECFTPGANPTPFRYGLEIHYAAM